MYSFLQHNHFNWETLFPWLILIFFFLVSQSCWNIIYLTKKLQYVIYVKRNYWIDSILEGVYSFMLCTECKIYSLKLTPAKPVNMGENQLWRVKLTNQFALLWFINYVLQPEASNISKTKSKQWLFIVKLKAIQSFRSRIINKIVINTVYLNLSCDLYNLYIIRFFWYFGQ